MDRSDLSHEMQDLIERVSVRPHGLGFLHLGEIESVAVCLGVHPRVVADARGLLEMPEGRALLIAETRAARERHRGESSPPERTPATGAEPSCPQDAPALLSAAERHPFGTEFLLTGPPEAVAITFGVHPSVVFRARALLENRRAGQQSDRCGGELQ